MSIKHHWVAILVTTLVTFIASVVLTVTQPMEYRSAFTVLAIDQDQNLDGYAAAKSAERLSQSLAKTVATTAFADQVYMQLKDRSDMKDNALVSSDAQTRRDEWKKRITAQSYPDVGQVKVSVYQSNQDQVGIIANAVSIAITAYGAEYLGGGNNVVLKIVDTPLTSKTPVRPNVFANVAVGLILGFAGSIAFFLLFAPQAPSTMPMLYAPMSPQMLAMMQQVPPQMPSEPQPMSAPVQTHRAQRVSHEQPLATPTASEPMPPTKPAQATETTSSSPANLPVIDEWVMP